MRVKLWSADGRVLYSDDRRLIGVHFTVSDELQRAFAGTPVGEVSDLSAPENELERGIWGRLLDFYLPVA